MSDEAEQIKELIKASVKLIKEGNELAERHRELVDELKKNIAKLEGKIKSKPD